MSNSNYPAGVSDNHPHFNPKEGSCEVSCGNEEADVLPFYAVSQALEQLEYDMRQGHREKAERDLIELRAKLGHWRFDDATYECRFEGVVDTDISEEAEWQCPVCGRDRVSNTLPEERDPDEAWDRRGDDD